MTGVLQEWVTEIPMKMQSVLLAATRGPDHAWCPRIKQINRWIRHTTQVDADPKNDFMVVKKLPPWNDELEWELGYCPVHYYQHLTHALEIIAYKHPTIKQAETAWRYYYSLCNMLHMNVEVGEELEYRLQDNPSKKIEAIGFIPPLARSLRPGFSFWKMPGKPKPAQPLKPLPPIAKPKDYLEYFGDLPTGVHHIGGKIVEVWTEHDGRTYHSSRY